MSQDQAATVHIDGAARGNPGPAAFAFVISRPGNRDVEDKGCLGSTTNNQAEYTALIRALEKAHALGIRRLLIHSDSELLVKQMNGEYRVKNEALRELYQEARELSAKFEQVTFRHVRREENRRADELCNEALDGEAKPAPRAGAVRASPARLDAARAEALECLRSAAASWARGDARHPDPAQVWDQLWSILEEHGLVKSTSR